MANYLKLHRKMLDWGWYSDINTRILFFHCLLKTNWKSGEWHGIRYDAGEFITSLQTLSIETGLSFQQVRTALQHLISTGEITSRQQGKSRIITVNNWVEYQADNKEDNKELTRLQQDVNKVVTTDIDIKKSRSKERKNIYGEFRHVSLTETERDRLFKDYGEAETLEAIKFLDEYKERKGYTSKNDNLTLRKWVFDAVKRDKAQETQSQSQSQSSSPVVNPKAHNFEERDYDYAALESELFGNGNGNGNGGGQTDG